MKVYSRLLNRYYNDDEVVYVANMLQCARYMKNGAAEDLVDILYDGVKREDTLVFVFQKTQRIRDLYKKWQNHELN